jgi:hypothetical protein
MNSTREELLFALALTKTVAERSVSLDRVKGSVLDIGYSPPSFLQRYKRWNGVRERFTNLTQLCFNPR